MMDQMYLGNIEEALEDEGKIVSYKWLSLHLKVPANTAKQMLYEYFHNKKADNVKLNATYLVSGISYDKNMGVDAYKVCVVKGCHLELMKSKMKTLFSVHIYSLQKCNLKDFNVIQATNSEKVRECIEDATRYTHVNFPSLKRRKVSEVQPHKEEVNKDDKPRDIPMKENASVTKPTKQAPLQKSKIASMFVNQAKNIEAGKKTAPVRKPAKAHAKNSLSGFLVKREPGSNPPKNDKSAETKMTQKEDIKPVIKVESSDEMIEDSPAPSPPQKQNTRKTYSQPKNKEPVVINQKSNKSGKRKSKPDSTSQSKRRRILQLDSSDSSSDERTSEDEDECPFPPEAAPSPPCNLESDDEPIPSTPQENKAISLCGKQKRVGKLVDRTYTDEDGFLVTKKEYVCVSDTSDNESPIPIKELSLINGTDKISPKKESQVKESPKKKPAANSSPKQAKKASPKKTKASQAKPKQASIMNFFKKK